MTKKAPDEVMFSATLFIASLPLFAYCGSRVASAADQDATNAVAKVAGILIDKRDDWISVKADGEEEPVKYVTGDASDKALADSLKSLFTES